MVQQTSVTGRDKEMELGIFLLKQQFFENEISGEQDAESWLQIKHFLPINSLQQEKISNLR